MSILDKIHLGELELVRSDKDFGNYTLDATFVPLRRSDGKFDFINTSFCEEPYYHKFIGTPENIFESDCFYTIDYNGYSDNPPSGVWIMSAYKFDDGMLVGFCHRELISRTDPAFGNCFFIGLAVSHDGGNHWKYIGDVAGNVLNGGHLMANMGGCPLLVKDDFFYIYFNDYDAAWLPRVTGARMLIRDTYKCLKEGKLPEVFKYTGSGIWKTDPMKCTGAAILPDVGFAPDAHAKGVYCKALDRYLLTMQTNHQSRLILYISRDCEHFDEYLIIDEAEEGKWMQPYSFFISTDGDCTDDMNEIGREFYIYFPRKGLLGGDYGDYGNYAHDDLYRRKVIVR